MDMIPDKQIKKKFKLEASKNPEKYYPTKALKKLGFSRGKCNKCKTNFWSVAEREVCGDASCTGSFTFIGNTPATKKLNYLDVWKEFTKIHKKLGYTPIDRYPVVARWRDDVEFVQAGIYDFQPYVVSGEVDPPANPVVEPQFCLRFNDIDNVGITGSHYVGFIMLGEHSFQPPTKFSPDQYVQDHLTWLNEGMGLSNEHITIHEDAWAGGGNFGPCIEFFSCGLEISNQVYIQFEQTETGHQELNLKVLDMGQGYERIPWFTQGTATSYETTFPTVIEKLRKITKVKYDQKLMQKFLPYAPLLNVDETDNVEKVWQDIAKKIEIDLEDLKEGVLPLRALYSIADHSRALLLALNDGALPSNTGGGYNLRVILRRALGFIDQYNWKIDLGEVCQWHAEFLKPLFPELTENLKDVKRVLEVEKIKYESSKQKAQEIVSKVAKGKINEKTLLELYDSHGISPELIKEQVDVVIPSDFYIKVAELHQEKETVKKKVKKEIVKIKNVPETKQLFYDDWKQTKFKAKILLVDGKNVVLDKTYFYATSGGQDHDLGTLDGINVVNVVKQGNYTVHVLEKGLKVKVGSSVSGEVDFSRREQLTQHHTSAHIINAAARRVLGNHVNQAGARKTLEKGTLDITHYSSLSEEEIKKIETEANKIVASKIEIRSKFIERTEAEQLFGMSIYQGGAVPGKELRIVEIPEVDIEACGGIHLKNTAEADEIKIVSSSKISDAVVRITYVAGQAVKKIENVESGLLEETAKILKVSLEEVPGMAQALFTLWKKARKAVKKGGTIDLTFPTVEKMDLSPEELLKETARIFSTQIEHVPKTALRFLKELEEFKKKLGK